MSLQVGKVQTTDQIRVLIDSEEFQFRFECGFSAPSSALTVGEKEDIMKSLSLHYLIYANRAEIDQLMDGLKTLGVLQLMQQHPSLFKPLLLSSAKPSLTSSQMVKLFQPIWSVAGSNQREKEELIILNWTTYLDETQGVLLNCARCDVCICMSPILNSLFCRGELSFQLTIKQLVYMYMYVVY